MGDETLVGGAWSLGAAMNVDRITPLLDAVEQECATRPDFTHAIGRAEALSIISATLWLYGCRGSDTSAAYAYEALYRSLGIDLWRSNLVRLPATPAQDGGDHA